MPEQALFRNPDGILTHAYYLRIYFQDTDAGGIVYHANFLAFGERARTEAMRAMGAPHGEMVSRFGVMFVVQRAVLDYQRPARLDEVIRIETQLVTLSGARAKLRQEFLRDSDSLAVLEISLGCARIADGKGARIPADWLGRLRKTFER